MRNNYDILTDESKITETRAYTNKVENFDYREYKKALRRLQINFEQSFSELKENIDNFENKVEKKKESDIYLFTINSKQKIDDLEKTYDNGLSILNLMKTYASNNNNSTYLVEVTRYCGIFEKFKIHLQNVKNTFDKTYLSYITYQRKNYDKAQHIYNNDDKESKNRADNASGGNSGFHREHESINHVFKERSALEFSLNELDNMIAQGQKTTLKLKNQNYNIIQQLKKVDLINHYIPKIHKLLKKIKYYNFKKAMILASAIATCIFIFFIFR